MTFAAYLAPSPGIPSMLQGFSQSVQRFGIGRIFHIFPTMQTQRQELIIQGSNDGNLWLTYEFKYKPGNHSRAPEMIIPHQPRIDWMVWFVPTQQTLQMEWFGRLMQRLHQGSEPVTALLKQNPFPDRSPRYLRVASYNYRFTTPEERQRNGDWWRSRFLGYFPMVAPRRP
jgi:hypothetical protein